MNVRLLVTISLAVLAAGGANAQSAPAGGASGAVVLPPSTSRERGPAAAQRHFEMFRRSRLPTSYVGAPRCDEHVGRFCYWLDDGSPPPEEPKSVSAARRELLDSLATAAARAPDDGWVAGQRVRYFVEDRDAAGALAAARACGEPQWWCEALRGYALHAGERVEEAGAAFDSALRAMPASEACRYTDVTPWLARDERDHFGGLPCPSAERDAAAQALWHRADPFPGRAVNEARVVFFARRTAGRLLAAAAGPQDEKWGSDVEELGMRYGFPTSWALDASTSVQEPWPRVVSHEPVHALPLEADGRAVARFTVAGADTVIDLAPRTSRFRRGDSLLVVAAYDASALRALDSATHAPLRAAAALTTTEGERGAHAARDSAATDGAFTLYAPNAPRVVNLEALIPAERRAARATRPLESLDSSAAVSDLLLVRAERVRGRPDVPLDSLLDAVDGRAAVPAGEPVGLYWEAYRGPTEAESLTVELRIVPTNFSLARRLAAALRLRELPPPSSITWASPPRPTPGDGHSLVLETAGLPPGTYRLELHLHGGGPDAYSSLDLRVAP